MQFRVGGTLAVQLDGLYGWPIGRKSQTAAALIFRRSLCEFLVQQRVIAIHPSAVHTIYRPRMLQPQSCASPAIGGPGGCEVKVISALFAAMTYSSGLGAMISEKRGDTGVEMIASVRRLWATSPVTL